MATPFALFDSLIGTFERHAKNLDHITLPEIKDFNALRCS
ncbi:hypothetical protein RD1_2677 [Roseobacter denitrificans OCh 114]|uniref:Uncharacterized protein n=1 Tax=Roseobacter denitrificans (strain ATCC 33942 / OCh 114) TaxID=375451 RepID=Q165X2_ROSDO|nr:hypothetical protein RD1_2677 [Roseobacter denitrificans OCh 114]